MMASGGCSSQYPEAVGTKHQELGNQNRNLLSQRSGDQKSEITVWAGLAPSGGSNRVSFRSLLVLAAAAVVGMSTSLQSLRLSSPLSLMRTSVTGLRAHPISRMISRS